MNKLSRLTALLLALIILLGSVSLAEGGLPIAGTSGLTSDDWADLVDAAEDKLFFTDEGDTGKEITPESPEQPEKSDFYPYTDVEALRLTQSDASAEVSITASGAAILFYEAAGQWQIFLGGVWANLSGETGENLTVTRTMMNGQPRAEFRKALGEKNAETGEYAAYTQTAVINLIENPPAMFSVSRDASDTAVSDANDGIMTLELANQENMVLVQVVYRIKGTDQPVADAYIGQIAKGSALNTTLTLPRVTGYTASAITGTVAEISIPEADLGNYATFIAPEGDSQGTLQLTVTKELSKEDITIYVEYEPAEVNFTVKHMQQEVDKETYKEFASETMTGLTGAQVGEGHAKTYDGFTAIWYDPTTTIAADGSTVVEIHYNREYYLLTFDLGDGYGVEPIFAMFGTTVGDVSEPTRAGYDFAGWVDADGNEATVPEEMPAYDVELTAKWTPGKASFIVAYWLDDPNKLDDKGDPVYNYWGSYEVTQYADGTEVKSGDIVQGITYKDYPAGVADKLDKHERRYSKYHHADENVPVKGDGSTVVNVYYHRNEYTLKFYYAMQYPSEEYYVVGGSTYYFGKENGSVNYRSNEQTLFSYYIDNPGNLLGKTDEPTLNARGQERKYTKSKEEYTHKGETYQYHYISFKAKYGADISGMWPCDVFNSVVAYSYSWDKSNKAYVSAWNGEYNVWYSQNVGNQTIKGNYTQLDSKLLWANSDPDDMTVTYLCFWENGSTAGWNIPELYRYHIWVPVLENQNIENETIKELNGVTYYLHDVYDTVDDSMPHQQTAPAMAGFSCINSNTSSWDKNSEELDANWKGENGGDDNWKWIAIPDEYYTTDASGNRVETVRYAYEINWFYQRNTYDMQFASYTDERTVKAIPFGSDVSSYEWLPSDNLNDADALPYPSNQEEGALQFVGWYTTPTFIAGTEFKFDTMPAHDVALYAKWELVKHKVTFWIDADKTVQVVEYPDVTHGMSVIKAYSEAEYYKDPKAWMDEHPDQSGKYNLYNFDGWYYMDGGVEKRFDIKNMPIKTDMDIYAKWTSTTPVEFVFYYQHVEKMGTTEYLAEPYIGKALPNTPVTMSAKIGDDLTLALKEDKSGYIPEVNSHTIILDVDPAKNVFTFYYQEPVNVKYTVQYLEAKYENVDGKQVLVPKLDGEGKLIHKAKEKTVSTEKAVVTENYVPVIGYMPQATQLRLIVSTNETMNVIKFLYLPNTTNEYINATHILIDHEKNEIIAGTDQNILGVIGQKKGVKKREYTGYEFSHAEAVVTVLDGDQVTTTTVTAEDTSGDMVQHTLPNGGMHLYLYYEPIKYPVVIQYLDNITERPLKDADGEEIPFKTVNLPYESIVKTEDHYKEIPDYRYVRMDPLEHKVRIEPDPDNPTVNVLKIFYTLDVANIKISKTITESPDNDAQKLTDEQWQTAFPFTVKLTPKAGKSVEKVDVTLPGKERGTMTTENGVLTFALKNNESAIIHDLWVGTKYEIEETEDENFKTTYSVTASGTLDSMGVDMTVTNTYPKYVGELIIKKAGLTGGESAIVKAEVGSDIYYLVLNATNGYTATISGIKPNTKYEVSEVTNWTWQYEPDVKLATGTIMEDQATATVTINNTKETDKWLHDESHVENDFGTGQSTGVNN